MRLEDIDCAREGDGCWCRAAARPRLPTGRGRPEPLDGAGRLLGDAPPGLGPDGEVLDAELAPDGQAALLLEMMGGVDVLRLDALDAGAASPGKLPGGASRRVSTGSGITTPAGGGGELRWSARQPGLRDGGLGRGRADGGAVPLGW